MLASAAMRLRSAIQPRPNSSSMLPDSGGFPRRKRERAPVLLTHSGLVRGRLPQRPITHVRMDLRRRDLLVPRSDFSLSLNNRGNPECHNATAVSRTSGCFSLAGVGN